MEKMHNTSPNNPYRYVKATHHYFATNAYRWNVSTDLEKLILEFNKEKMDYHVWYVALPLDAPYEIDRYIPMVENAHLIGGFYQDMEPNQFKEPNQFN